MSEALGDNPAPLLTLDYCCSEGWEAGGGHSSILVLPTYIGDLDEVSGPWL